MGPVVVVGARRLKAAACALSVLFGAIGSAAGATLTVPAGGDLQSALNTAQPGDTINLAAGATYTGNFRLPVKTGDAVITVQTDLATPPPSGTRITPEAAANFAKLKSPNSSAALSTADAAHHWRIQAIEFMANANGAGDIISLGSGSQTQTSQMPHDLVFDRVYVHGDATTGQKRGIALNSGYTEIRNSYIADIKGTSQDTQAICGWNGTGPYVIENNYLEAAGENVLFGGADANVWSLVPADITVRGNTLSKPTAWRQQKWMVKNAFELKNARRVLVEGNVIENVWKSGQSGFAVVLTPRNQDGKAPWSLIEDVTIRNNIVRHAGGAFNLSGWDDIQSSQQMRRVQIANNVVYDIDSSWGGAGIFLQVGNSPGDVVVEHNTAINSGTVVNVYGTKNGAPWIIDGFVYRDNLSRHNTYGVFGDSRGFGQGALNAYFADLIFARNVLAGGDANRYPAGNYFPSVADFDAGFVNVAGEDFTLTAGNPFRTLGTDGTAVGADVPRVTAAVRGVPAPAPGSATAPTPGSSSTGETAVCRTGQNCGGLAPYSRQRH